MKYYYTLWMPTRKDGKPSVFKEPKRKTLCDKWSLGEYHLNGWVDKNSLDFTIYYRAYRFYIPTGKERKVLFKAEEVNNKGFVVYSSESDPFGRHVTFPL